ncbi:MAG: hypothetical protein J1E38_04075 [Paramuribaculum sp.]|nr:hypothetical protein [Paramuribaculum sp.]
MTKKEIDKWNARHFLVCMQILKGFSKNSNGMLTKLDMDVIIIKANRLIQLLQQREAKIMERYEEERK